MIFFINLQGDMKIGWLTWSPSSIATSKSFKVNYVNFTIYKNVTIIIFLINHEENKGGCCCCCLLFMSSGLRVFFSNQQKEIVLIFNAYRAYPRGEVSRNLLKFDSEHKHV